MHFAHSPRSVVLAVTAAVGAPALGAEPMYHVTRLANEIETVFPGVEYPSSDPGALNENGDLVGMADLNGGQMQGFVYTVEHGVVPLPLLPGWGSAAVTDVTDRDANGEIIIVGGSAYGVHLDIAVGEAMLWRYSTVTNQVLEMRGLGIPAGQDESIAVAVNNSGTIVGISGVWGPWINWKYDIATSTMEIVDFPAKISDMNNAGEVCGGSYRGDLFGNWEDLTDTYEPGDVMPDWAIENGGISAGWSDMNDLGWLVGTSFTGISDGTGHYLRAIVRFADPIGWTGIPPCCWIAASGGINDRGDFTDATGGIYLEDTGQVYSINSLLAPEFFQIVNVAYSPRINNNRQIIGAQAHALLLTPLGEMIIPGDITGDVQVDLDDHCAWVANPIDLDGDGDVDAADEQWMLDRLAVFGFQVLDCNGNGAGDHCDILAGLSSDCDFNDMPDECQADCNGDGVPDACEPDCNGNGTPDPCDIAQGASEDCNTNGIPDECDGGGTTIVSTVFDPPLELVANTTASWDITVTDVGIVSDVDFDFDISYRVGDMSATLSHNGTTITLLDRPGYPENCCGNGQLGYDAVLDDEGTGGPIEDEGNFGSPFTQIVSPPNYTPDEPLSTFDGMPMEGVWTLSVTIGDYHPAHTFQDWGLTIERAGAHVEPCDCNANGTPDAQDISGGTSADADGNGIPDECQDQPGDANGDGVVGVDDILMVILQWGPCRGPPAPCDGDLDGDGQVGIDDVTMVVLNWS